MPQVWHCVPLACRLFAWPTPREQSFFCLWCGSCKCSGAALGGLGGQLPNYFAWHWLQSLEMEGKEKTVHKWREFDKSSEHLNHDLACIDIVRGKLMLITFVTEG